MKLTIKTLKQEQLNVEAEPSCKISELKQKICEKYSHPAEVQRLIFAGKILDDAQTIESYKISEKDFLVLMVKKTAAPAKKSTPAPSPAPTTTTPAATPAAAPAPVATTPATEPAAPAAESPAPAAASESSPAPAAEAPSSAADTDSNSMVTGNEYEATIARIAEMGFEREQIIIALEASFNNPNRAIEYLMDPVLLQQAHAALQSQAAQAPAAGSVAPGSAPAQAAGSSPAAAAGSTPAAGTPAAGTPAANPASANLFEQAQAQASSAPSRGSAFEQLRQLPNFDSIRQLIQQQPQLLQHVLQNLAQANPQLYQIIVQNQQEFIQLLNEPVPEGTPSIAEGLGGAGGQGGSGPAMPQGPGPVELRVTPEEKEAIERLEGLGFPRHKVLEAYISCDKDENLAANFLLEHGYDDDDNMDQTE